jgi:hypothetical protein
MDTCALPSEIQLNGDPYVLATPESLACAVAGMLDDDQAKFFNALGLTIKAWKSYNYGEPQWVTVSQALDDDGKGLVRSIAQFLEA